MAGPLPLPVTRNGEHPLGPCNRLSLQRFVNEVTLSLFPLLPVTVRRGREPRAAAQPGTARRLLIVRCATGPWNWNIVRCATAHSFGAHPCLAVPGAIHGTRGGQSAAVHGGRHFVPCLHTSSRGFLLHTAPPGFRRDWNARFVHNPDCRGVEKASLRLVFRGHLHVAKNRTSLRPRDQLATAT